MKYIAIEGIIGAGKTTLAKAVAESTGGRLVLEEFAENPYLEAFYKDPAGKAFHLEMSFLAARTRQLTNELISGKDFLITDYYFHKTQLFASLNLNQDELSIFNHYYNQIATEIREPDLLVFIDTLPHAASGNIKKRGRPYETGISGAYLERIYQGYQNLLAILPVEKVLKVPQQSGNLPTDSEILKRIMGE